MNRALFMWLVAGVACLTEKPAADRLLCRDTKFSTRSRLALLWQSTCEAEFYGTDEIAALQVR